MIIFSFRLLVPPQSGCLLTPELTRVTTSILGHSQTDDWDVINFSVLGIHEDISYRCGHCGIACLDQDPDSYDTARTRKAVDYLFLQNVETAIFQGPRLSSKVTYGYFQRLD